MAGDKTGNPAEGSYERPEKRLRSDASGEEGTCVPEVDFGAFQAAEVPPPGSSFVPTDAQRAAGRQLREILTTHGFVYATGLLSPDVAAAAFAASRRLFAPSTDRDSLVPLGPETNMGYGRLGGESLNARRAADQKEAFNVRKAALDDGSPLERGTPAGFLSSAKKCWEACCRAALQALLAFGVALELENPAKFAQSLKVWDLCTLRFLHYPASAAPPSDPASATGALPCGEHTDFGAVTLLMLEDGSPGLEARRPEGGWMPAHGKQGTILLNTGAMLSRWCNDAVKATPHRVVWTPNERYSIAFFCDPDAEELIEVLPEFAAAGKSEAKYPPITAGGYLRQCLNGTLKGEISEEAKRSLVV